MSKDFYETYIASTRWAAKRSDRLDMDGHRCRTCNHDGSQWRLEVHHRTYARLGNEDVEWDLITLCCQCHEAITSVIRSRRYDGRPVDVLFFKEAIMARKEARSGVENFNFSVACFKILNR